jgi:hypothetical protein
LIRTPSPRCDWTIECIGRAEDQPINNAANISFVLIG